MTGKFICWCAALLLATQLLAATAIPVQAADDCPGSSYSPCHYNFPLLWRLCAHISGRWCAPAEMPPPFSDSYYDYRSHCPYADPAALSGFPSLTQRSKLATGANSGP